VTAGFFALFGAPVLHGRVFTAEEDRPGASPVAVLSHQLWIRRFAADPGAIGQTVLFGSTPHVIVGVLAPGFDSEQFDQVPDAWVPFQIDPATDDRGSYCTVTGRLKAGVTLETANAEMTYLADEYRRMVTDRFDPRAGFAVQPLLESMGVPVRSSLMLLLAAVGFVLLIACANVANLLLARATARSRELAIRAAVGAGRWRMIRQLLTESMVLSSAGGLLGLGAGLVGIRVLLGLYPAAVPFPSPGNPVTLPRLGEGGAGVALDWRVLAFTIGVSFATGLLFGLIPARSASRPDLTTALKESNGKSTGLRQSRSRSLLVMSEAALALILLTGAGLLIRTYAALRAVDPGFDTAGVLTTQVSVTGTRFERTSNLDQLVREGVGRMRALPGVASASAACCIPLETVWQLPFIVAGRPLERRFHGFAGWTFVSPEYFETFRIPVLRGRSFTERDNAAGPAVALINQSMARLYWSASDPLGASLLIGRGMRPEYDADAPRQVIGIVGDTRDSGLNLNARPAMYVPVAQLPDAVNVLNLRLLPMAWFVRLKGEPAGSPELASAIRNRIEQASGGLPVSRLRSMDEISARSTARTRFSMLLMTIFGAAALLLAAVGVYGLMAYSVEQRRRELGIRMALGAARSQVRNMVVIQGMRLALIGTLIGVGAALGLARFLAGFLFGVEAWDPAVFASAPILLNTVALAAVWVPALRATRVDPAGALRHD
jgi:predicted permease